MLNLSASLLDAMNQRHDMRRGRETLQLDLSYRGSILAQELRAQPRRVQAGDRAPDAAYLDADGVRRRLFERFQGPDFVLLGYGCAPEALDQIAAAARSPLTCMAIAASAEGELARDYDLTGPALILVRPDGYIGLAADPADGAAVADYLNALAPPCAQIA